MIIIGAGPNLGQAVARRFGSEGIPVGLISRDKEKLDGLVAELEGEGITAASAAADIRDSDALASRATLSRFAQILPHLAENSTYACIYRRFRRCPDTFPPQS